MREESRIKRITNLLCKIWEKHPDYRFYQLLINEGLIIDDLKLWHVEDDEIEKWLKKKLK